jgi:hypothetical protein
LALLTVAEGNGEPKESKIEQGALGNGEKALSPAKEPTLPCRAVPIVVSFDND